jgi:hypothetical protein
MPSTRDSNYGSQFAVNAHKDSAASSELNQKMLMHFLEQ